MAERDYYIMSGDTTVAKWENNELPLYLKRVHNANMWLETRAIDSHRANSRLLKMLFATYKKEYNKAAHPGFMPSFVK